MNSQQTKPQEMVKMSNGQFYDGTVRTVKQRAHKFNAIAISNINAANNNSNIPMPSKTIGGSNNASSMTKVNNKNSENARKNVLVNGNGHHRTSSSTTNIANTDSNNNHNIKINIVNKYTTNKNTTHVATKNINTEQEKNNGNQIDDVTSTIITKSDNSSNVIGTNNTSKILLNTNDVKIKINQLNQSNVASVSPTKPKAPAPPIPIQQQQQSSTASTWNSSGWIRVYCGPDRSEISIEDPNRMVMVYSNSTTSEVVKDMGLPSDYTLWCQIGQKSRRLEDYEQPFKVQEEFLMKLGYHDESRRSRLGIDLDLKYLIRFHIGPIDIPLCKGATKCGNIELLKGLVFPQWKRRTIAIIGTKLIVYPANQSLMPETYELSGSEIFEHGSVYNRLIIKIVPKISDSLNNTMENLTRNNKSTECLNINSSSSASSPNSSNLSSLGGVHHNSNLSVSSQSSEVVLFLGFEESWERDLWSNWLMEVSILKDENFPFVYMLILSNVSRFFCSNASGCNDTKNCIEILQFSIV
ncbi:hypothetical protein PVAND_005730 [Polypedilum vanderplanki]|uniref:PHLPP-like RA domain-containing protein n=1 Tax=Polypedilum vanderplanki TaxID=319348 RepID=A0A9J6C2X6_POLVA|nr:hypothetical protein PVAND_005730 [Polypedilum vanderplanki]